jgi:hypothetical protein
MLVYDMAIWSIFGIGHILWPCGTFHGYSVYFFPFWYIVPRKIWQQTKQNLFAADANWDKSVSRKLSRDSTLEDLVDAFQVIDKSNFFFFFLMDRRPGVTIGP